ncbi:MAG: riboflavin biosynthesis protein RibF, partial [Thermoanaerobaculia bacterium]
FRRVCGSGVAPGRDSDGVKIVNGFLDLDPFPQPVVATIGNFDGMHLGHQRIFARVRERAASRGLPAWAVTFDPHPLTILRPDRAPRMILTRGQKIDILRAEGFDGVLFIPFDLAISEVEPERFVEEFMIGRLRVAEIYIGVDFRFGRGRRGDLELLRRMAAGAERAGGPAFRVESAEIVRRGEERISASLIREALAAGDVAAAAEMMGRPYEAIGDVVRGAGRGRSQGAPTANIEVANEVIPASGVYITETVLASSRHPGLTNIGTRPTFEGAGFAVETWLPDFKGDLYGRRLRVSFHARIRDERKFPSAGALREQIGRDLEVMRAFFAARGQEPSRT